MKEERKGNKDIACPEQEDCWDILEVNAFVLATARMHRECDYHNVTDWYAGFTTNGTGDKYITKSAATNTDEAQR